METSDDSRAPVVGAFKGFMKTHKLVPFKEGRGARDPEYRSSLGIFFCSGEEGFEFQYRVRDYDRVLDCVERQFGDQVDRRFVSRCLMKSATEWVEQGHSLGDQSQLEGAAYSFLEEVATEILDRVVYVPVEGIKATVRSSLQLSRCELHPNTPDSELRQQVLRHKERVSWDEEFVSACEQAPVFLKVAVTGHSGQTVKRAIEEVDLALDVLRLFWSSFYFDRFVRPSAIKQMGLVGTLPSAGVYNRVLSSREGIPIDEQYPGVSESYRHHRPMELGTAEVRRMNDLGLVDISRHLCAVEGACSGDAARCLMRAIKWFGKATTPGSISESFLLFAISAEGLLSGGDRISKEVYAERMAALVTRCGEETIFPMGGYISAEFGKKLRAACDRSDRFNVVRNRSIELFSERNDIVHGAKLEDDVDPWKLLDFETLVRNSILSFVNGGWNSLGEFKHWVNESLSYRFSPVAL